MELETLVYEHLGDNVTRLPTVKQWSKASRSKGLKGALKERDDKFENR